MGTVSGEMTRMRFCGCVHGEGGDDGTPCPMYCSSVMQTCMKYHLQFSDVWDSFVDAIDKVGDRLLGPYNIEVDGRTPEYKNLRGTIMNFQESGTEVSQKIYSKCGKPTTLSRPKRKADYKDSSEDNPNMEIKAGPIKVHGKKKKNKKVVEPTDNKSVLEKIIGDIKQKIKDTKQFWLHLPYQFCNNLSLHSNASNSSQCWNGTEVGPFEELQQKSIIGESTLLNEQVYILQGLTEKLQGLSRPRSRNGGPTTEEPLLAGSGSGSGDGDFEDAEEDGDMNHGLVFHEDRQPDVFPTSPPSSTRMPEVVRASSGNTNDMSLTRALISLLLPMVLAWFGSAITNLL
ncbi:hypothetical protein NQ317_018993 [Molorchus minor]|uniref:Uncharacterized protein n=1 Tax=Molorchus minor TaxID=1323400 RepID=A0ABQ9JLV0_9CUCU|nr:hypothetical protein NQ317_018993 [Molorchus minor]